MKKHNSLGNFGLPCLVCGVDSGPVLTFFFWLVGGGVLAFLAIGFWAYLNGKFSAHRASAELPLQAEGIEGVDHGNR
jgi:hypothetical protein